METPSNPSERFLALSLRRQSSTRVSRIAAWWEPVETVLLFLGGVVLIVAILAGLSFYVYFCFAAQCVKAAEPNAKSRETAVKPAEVNYVWVQLMPDEESTPGGRLVRTIGPEDGTCPTIAQAGNTFQMHQRVPAVRAAFPIMLCEFVLIETSEARIASVVLPARPVEPRDIVVLGDTGCRMVYWQIQPCRSIDEWPFARIASSAAGKLSGKRDQSLILHLGDLHYREHQCADSSTRCGGSPFGDNWETWNKEFFTPAQPLLLSAPWIVMRGNHEDCNRAGAGWVFLFALPGQHNNVDGCDSEPASYNVSIGKTDETPQRPRILLVMDTSDEKNTYKIKDRCHQYMKLLEPLDKIGPEYWLALHQPLWGRRLDGRAAAASDEPKPAASEKPPCEKTKSAITAIRDKLEARQTERLARVTLAGDTHAFQFFAPETASTPIQIIAGNGGTALDILCKAEKREKTDEACENERDDGENKDTYQQIVGSTQVPDQNIKSYGISGSSLTFVQHGFTVMHRNASIWTATEFDKDGSKIVDCRFSEAVSTEASNSKPGCPPES